MSIVNAKLLSDNLRRMNDLHNVGFSDETLASAARDKTGDTAITADDVAGFRKLGNIGSSRMLISAKQGKKLKQFAKDADATGMRAIEAAKNNSRVSESVDTEI